MDDLQSLKALYELASAFHEQVSKENRALALSGGHPSEAALQREDEAEAAMVAAREAYLQALAGPAG